MGPEDRQFNDGFKREAGRQSWIGRFNYSYDRRYALEFNFRYDGSSIFPEDGRWGFFPSYSAAWNVSEESFISDNPSLSFLSMFRLRASYGNLGFDRAADWQHLATFNLNEPYKYEDEGLTRGIISDGLPNPDITWERLTITNLGAQIDLWDGLLSADFEVFERDRREVLADREAVVPNTIGAELPQENYERYNTRGWDLGLNHTHTIGDVSYRLKGVLSWNRSKLVFTEQRDFVSKEDERRNSAIGRFTDAVWMMPSEGLFTSQDEIDNWADIDGQNNATIQVGDIKFTDLNGDGRITAEDRILVGSGDRPRLSFSLNGGVTWRGFDFYMMWQGASAYGHNLRNIGNYTNPFQSESNLLRYQVDDTYVPEGDSWRPANTNAKWPNIAGGIAGNSNFNSYSGGVNSADLWWVKGDYLRLRIAQLSYRLPERFTSRFGVNSARIILAGYNLLTLTGLDFIDPEYDTNSGFRGRLSTTGDEGTFGASPNTYPQTGSFQIGVEVDF